MSYVKRKEVVTKVAYLIGVPEDLMYRDFIDSGVDIKDLFSNREASIIRCLSKLRSYCTRNFLSVDRELRYELKFIQNVSHIDTNDIALLEGYGIPIKNANYRAGDYQRLFNKLIAENINACRSLFPDWVNWEYLRSLFVIPTKKSNEKFIEEYNKYNKHWRLYPYNMYIHWNPVECRGMLLDDCLFLKTLYAQHNDVFNDRGCFIEASDITKSSVYNFIADSNKVVLVVDCENVDVYGLFGFISNLDELSLKKISKIMLFDSNYTEEAWDLLVGLVKVPVEHVMVDRLKREKSLVDLKMTAGICQSHYRDEVDSFVLVASDSDYWGVISSLPSARFLVVYEKKKGSSTFLKTLDKNKISSCAIDDFYMGNVIKLKETALLRGFHKFLEQNKFSCKTIVDEVCIGLHMPMSDSEKQAFLDKHLKNMKLHIGKDWCVTIEVK